MMPRRAESTRTILLLHGGGGPQTVASLGAHLAPTARVIAPTLPGWNGTPRPPALDRIAAYADEYLRYLAAEALTDVVVIGSSIGGWLGAELALRDTARRIAALVIINGVGVEVTGHPIRNLSGLAPQEIAAISFHDPSRFGAGAPPPTPESLAVMRANQATLAAIAGTPYGCDPTLLARLGGIRIPTLVLWGASDGVVGTAYGRAYAAAIPGARFETIAEAGHLPHLEQPAATFQAIDAFVAEVA
ncbi:MAG: alpha/beta hydrolase [Deltaproteobacteria bacterium]|nr:alpha/beta hydrolase [Deltaproteobacteria bacterium]